MNKPILKNGLPPGKKLAFVQANWHQEIVEQSRISFLNNIKPFELFENDVDVFDVPGSLEIPLQCKTLANSGLYSIIIAAGLIVDGGIYRHDFVASTVLDGMMQVQLESEIPILSVVLTPHHFNDQVEHQQFFYEHFKVKGKEAALACQQILQNRTKLIEFSAS